MGLRICRGAAGPRLDLVGFTWILPGLLGFGGIYDLSAYAALRRDTRYTIYALPVKVGWLTVMGASVHGTRYLVPYNLEMAEVVVGVRIAGWEAVMSWFKTFWPD